MEMRFLPDEPITHSSEDGLGTSYLVDLIQSSICQTDPPFVFGVLGDWSSGKTSIMHMLQSRLNENLDRSLFCPLCADLV